MTYPEPTYQKTFSLEQLDYGTICTAEKLNAAANGVFQYMNEELFMPGSSAGMDGSVAKCFGLARTGSLVILKGLKRGNDWQTAYITVVNMQKEDDGLVKLLEKAAIESARK